MKYSLASDSACMKHNKCERLERWWASKNRTAKSLQRLLRTEVASTGMIMTEGDDARLVRLGNASPNDLIGTILEQVRIFPEKILHHGHKFGLILPSPMQRHLTGDKIVYYVSKPW
jgi:hypothetical protein